MTPLTDNIRLASYRTRAIWLVLILFMASGPVRSQVVLDSSAELSRVDIVEKIGDTIPENLRFVDDHGDTVQLGKYFSGQRPVVLILGYYECPMLCNLVFNGMVDGVNQLDWNPGKQFQIVTVSINPKEKYELAAAKKANYLKSINRPIDESGWAFLVGDSTQSRALADAIGFKYFYDSAQGQYAHPAGAYVLTPDGRISRYLYGIQFSKTDLKLSLLEASNGHLGTPMERLILYCYHYDPDTRGYTVAANNLMKLGGVASVLALGIFVSLLWFGERKRRRALDSTSAVKTEEAAKG